MTTTRPAGNSVAAIARRLARYSASPERCRNRGVDHAAVIEARRRFQAGEISAAAALTAAGLRPGPVERIQRLADSLTPDQLDRAIAHLQNRQRHLNRAG